MFCGYANGLVQYFGVIAARTEEYWCGIMHEKKKGYIPPEHHKDFIPYADKEAFKAYAKKNKAK